MVKTRLENNNGVYTSTAQKESARLSYLKTCGYDHNFKDPKLREKLRHKKRSIFEFDGKQVEAGQVVSLIEQAYKNEGHQIGRIKDLKVYINSKEGKAYYVINGDDGEGKYIEL